MNAPLRPIVGEAKPAPAHDLDAASLAAGRRVAARLRSLCDSPRNHTAEGAAPYLWQAAPHPYARGALLVDVPFPDDPAKLRQLVALGFREPAGVLPVPWLTVRTPADCPRAAALLVVALDAVFGVTPDRITA